MRAFPGRIKWGEKTPPTRVSILYHRWPSYKEVEKEKPSGLSISILAGVCPWSSLQCHGCHPSPKQTPAPPASNMGRRAATFQESPGLRRHAGTAEASHFGYWVSAQSRQHAPSHCWTVQALLCKTVEEILSHNMCAFYLCCLPRDPCLAQLKTNNTKIKS